jgi:hypothetical protein
MNVSELLVAAPRGDVRAQFALGAFYQNGSGVEKDDNEASHWYGRAAAKGNLKAQNALGWLLYEHQDYSNAARWLNKAAVGGDRNAQDNLATLYRRGVGVSQNDELAFHWFQKSALQGQKQAQRQLGKIYLSGRGTQPDYVAAYQWLKLAQLQGEDTETELKACAVLMTPEQIAAAEQLVRNFKPEIKPSPQ